MPLLFATYVQQGFSEEEKRHQVLTQQNLISHLKGRHRGEAVLRDFKQPSLLEWQWYSNVILRVRDFNCYFVAFYCNRLLRENSCGTHHFSSLNPQKLMCSSV